MTHEHPATIIRRERMALTLTKGDRLIEVSYRIEREPWRIEYDLSTSTDPYTHSLITSGLSCAQYGRMLNTASRIGYEVHWP